MKQGPVEGRDIWGTLYRCFPNLKGRLDGDRINDLHNRLTLQHSFNEYFKSFDIAFKATVCYRSIHNIHFKVTNASSATRRFQTRMRSRPSRSTHQPGNHTCREAAKSHSRHQMSSTPTQPFSSATILWHRSSTNPACTPSSSGISGNGRL